jgi:long-chain fatty acid transport protein
MPGHATTGYFSHGYGIKAKGMGGAAVALTEDAFGGANNPASMVWVGSRLDLGVELFIPKRHAERTGSAGAIFDGSADSARDYFVIPELAYNKMVTADFSIGVSVYGNGGLNTEYPASGQTDSGACSGAIPSGVKGNNLLCGTTRLGVDLIQLIIAPTLSYRLLDDVSFGVSPLIGYQRFRAEGLQAFANPISSISPGEVTNRGYDSAVGAGVRIGWLGKLSEALSFGAAYSTKVSMSRFGKYRGLFAEQGSFDIPENYSLGFAVRPTSRLVLAFDYERINHGDVRAVGAPSTVAAQFGSDNGPGFGWSNINVWKTGLAYIVNDRWTLRGGYSHSDNPIQGRDVTINILAPGVVTDHITLGMTYRNAKGREITLSYMHAFEKMVAGPSTLGAGGTDAISMYQDAFGIAFGWKL